MSARLGERHHYAKMTDKKVEELRDWYAEGGISQVELAYEFGIAVSTAAAIIRRETRKHVRPARISKETA
jgi:hypothetical protein